MSVRDRLTERTNRARLKLELRRSVRPGAVLAIGAALGVACIGYIAGQLGSGVGASTYESAFAVDNATAVVPGRHEVRIAGVPVGTITDAKRTSAGTILTAEIKSEHGRIFRDARATLRPKTALDDMFLDIVDRGTPAAGELDASRPLPERQTATSVDVAEVLQTFDTNTRARMHVMLRDLGRGLADRGEDLRHAFVELVPFLRVVDRLATELSTRSRKVRRLVSHSRAMVEELGRRDRQLRTLITAGGSTFSELESHAASLDGTLRALPSTLTTADASLAALSGVLDGVDGALVALRPVARALPAGLTSLRRVAASGTPAVDRLRMPLRRLRPVSDALPPLSESLRRAVTALRPQTGHFDYATRSVNGCLTPLTSALQWLPSVNKWGDAFGAQLRGVLVGSIDSVENAPNPQIHAPKNCAPPSDAADSRTKETP